MKGSIIHFLGVAVILLCIASTCMTQECKGKEEWPELLGVAGSIAVQTIQMENTLVKAFIVKEGDMVILNFDCQRVWVWVSRTNGTVIQIPRIG